MAEMQMEPNEYSKYALVYDLICCYELLLFSLIAHM